MSESPKPIKVRVGASRKGDSRVILNDQDDAHPDKHVLIRGTDSKTFTVGYTLRIRELLEQGLLEQVETSESKSDARGTQSA